MALNKTTVPYEILIRLSANGIEGSHYIEREVIAEDGVELSSRLIEAKPVPAGNKAFTDAATIAFAQVKSLKAQAVVDSATIAQLQADLSAATSAVVA